MKAKVKKIIGIILVVYGLFVVAGSFTTEDFEILILISGIFFAGIGGLLLLPKKEKQPLPAKATSAVPPKPKAYHVTTVGKDDYYVASPDDVLDHVTKEIDLFNIKDLSNPMIGKKVQIDDENKLIAYHEKDRCVLMAYDDIVDFEYRENGDQIMTGRGLQTAVGGIAFGGLGALVGMSGKRKTKQMVKQMQIVIKLDNLTMQHLKIDLITREIKKESPDYKQKLEKADQIIEALAYCMRKAEK